MLAKGRYGKCEVCEKQQRSQPALWNEDQGCRPETQWRVFRFSRLCCYSLKLRITILQILHKWKGRRRSCKLF